MIVIPQHLKGMDYWGSKKIKLDDSLTLADAKLILSESPSYGLMIVEEPVKKKSSKS